MFHKYKTFKMKKLEILEEVPMDTVLCENQYLVYDAMMETIEKSYADEKVQEIRVLELEIAGIASYLSIERNDFVNALKNCLKYFEKPHIEEYEKCTKCLNMINYLNKR